MPAANVIDRRSNQYDITCDAVFEPSCHDNYCKNATKFESTNEFTVAELWNTTVADAVVFAEQWDCPVTVYLYDLDDTHLKDLEA